MAKGIKQNSMILIVKIIFHGFIKNSIAINKLRFMSISKTEQLLVYQGIYAVGQKIAYRQ